jgi:hypothetical protein
MTKEQLQAMLDEDYNLNQIAAMHMISKLELEKLLVDEATEATSTGTKGKSKPAVNHGIQDKQYFEEEPGL